MTASPLNLNYSYTLNNIHGPNYKITLNATVKHPITQIEIPITETLLILKNTTQAEQQHKVKVAAAAILSRINPNHPSFYGRSERTPLFTSSTTIHHGITLRKPADLIICIVAISALYMFLRNVIGHETKSLPPLYPYL